MLGKLLLSSGAKRASAETIGLRMFSRADTIKHLNKAKVSRKGFIKKELTENPEFFKAYPHLQGILNVEGQDEDSMKPTTKDNVS